MTLSDLITAFRTRADDSAKPYLWSDDEITLYLNEAENEAATRGLLIQDSTTALVVNVNLLADTSVYKIHPSILKILSATLSDGTELTLIPQDDLALYGLDNETTGSPKYLYENGDGKITIAPIPVATDVVTLKVKRLPICGMSKEQDKPEINSRYHYRLIDWALRCAYLKTDSETFNADQSTVFEIAFEKSFGFFQDANVQRKQREKSRKQVRSSW